MSDEKKVIPTNPPNEREILNEGTDTKITPSKLKKIYSTIMSVPGLTNLGGILLSVVILTMYLNVKSDRDQLQAKLAIYESGTTIQTDSIVQKNKDENIILINDIKQSQNRLDSLVKNAKKDTLTLDEAMKILKGLK